MLVISNLSSLTKKCQFDFHAEDLLYSLSKRAYKRLQEHNLLIDFHCKKASILWFVFLTTTRLVRGHSINFNIVDLFPFQFDFSVSLRFFQNVVFFHENDRFYVREIERFYRFYVKSNLVDHDTFSSSPQAIGPLTIYVVVKDLKTCF